MLTHSATNPPLAFRITIAALGWFAVLAQFYIHITTLPLPLFESIIRFFSFFTILTNLSVAVCFTALLFKPTSGFVRFMAKPSTLTALTVYMTFLALVYHILLRNLWDPQGLQLVVDWLLHTIQPLLLLAYWLLFVQKDILKWQTAFFWLLYPGFYLLWVLGRGGFSGFYPYPFINAVELGYGKTFLNIGALAIILLVYSLLHIGIGKMITRKMP